MTFITDDFLLHTPTARRLYHDHAEHQPIVDYHTHFSPREIADNRMFATLYDIWLAADHYKWRAMRADGVDERYCTGSADPREKFFAWARTIPHTMRNPLYHWTHLELKRYFGIDELLNEYTAEAVWENANAQLQTPALSAQGILKKFNVIALCTTDDPADDLEHHKRIARSDLSICVYPTFRPDRALAVDNPASFNPWLEKLSAASDMEIASLTQVLDALDKRHAAFHEVGCRLSDHGIAHCFADFPSEAEAARIFDRARSGVAASPDEHDRFAAHMMLHFGRIDAKRGWVKQLHLGALRDVRTNIRQALGPDAGCDSIGDFDQMAALGGYLNRLDREGALPKTVLYNVNPVQNYAFAAMAGNFQDGTTPGKMQFGSGWWFMDSKEGIEWQLNALSSCGLLSRFIGMLTDSRSFMSFPRHEYFRRVLCNLLGAEVECGELPDDDDLLGGTIADICINNVRNYLALPRVTAA